MPHASLGAEGYGNYRLQLCRYTNRSVLFMCRTGWVHYSAVKVLHLKVPKVVIRLEWNRLCCCVRFDMLAALYISKYYRHCLQSFEVKVSSVLHRTSLQTVMFLLSGLKRKNVNTFWLREWNAQLYVSSCLTFSRAKMNLWYLFFIYRQKLSRNEVLAK
jgi:hypothetical protein